MPLSRHREDGDTSHLRIQDSFDNGQHKEHCDIRIDWFHRNPDHDIIEEHPEKFRATVLTAAHNWELLAAQARRFNPLRVVIACEEFLPNLRDALAGTSVRVEVAPPP